MDIKFIIVVPHGYCKDRLERHCDRVAKQESEKILNKLKSLGYDPAYFIADRYRSEMDYNRMAARDSPMRNDVRQLVKNYTDEKKKVIIFEVHSFPGKLYTFYDFDDADFAFLSIPRYSNDAVNMVNAIVKNTKVVPKHVQSTETNDIQFDLATVSNKLQHYLIEFNETKVQSADIYDVIVNTAIKTALKNPIAYWAILVFIVVCICIYDATYGGMDAIRGVSWHS
jgi:hypothetical protein